MLRCLAPVFLFCVPLCAQNDFDFDKLTAGTLGSSLDLAYSSAPASNLGLVMMSFSGGPTPLLIVDPGDSRSVQVGTELAASWFFSLSSPTGTGGYSLALPNNPGLANIVLHWQVATLATSGPTLVGPISNDVVTQTSIAGTSLLTAATLGAARAFGAGFFDRDNNGGAGDFIVAGGGAGTLTSATGLASTEVWDFRHMTRSAGNPMTQARALHLATTLNDGRVLICGGADATGAVLSSCEIYDPATNSYTATGSMGSARILHAACLLNDGRVLVAGGTSSLVDVTTAITSTLSSCEVYDPNTGNWSGAPGIGGRRLAPALTLLPNGQAMVSGGVQVGFIFGIPVSASSTTAVQRWTPGGSWSGGPNMSQGRAGHHYNQVRLNDGRILMTGGINVPSLLGATNAAPIAGAEIYNPTTNSWAAGSMGGARALHSASVMANGDVVVCGGAQGTLTLPTPIADVERFDPGTNTWSGLPALSTPRSSHAAAVMPDGTLLLFGGQGATTTLTSIETLRR